ncbi:hypothetical protein [Saccharopolyspora pogona]|uniref:hypothetical protein n=1 Tax=Saccharopolyspora pogona TaxID=333966 RepID=UPI00168605D7|nr:hypothetical protein [Saccharopolyspora pogona]
MAPRAPALRVIDARHHDYLTRAFAAAHEPRRVAVAHAVVSGEFRPIGPDTAVWALLALVSRPIDAPARPAARNPGLR